MSQALDTSARDQFLCHWEYAPDRGVVGNYFHNAVRGGADTPEAVVEAVKTHALALCDYTPFKDRDILVLDILKHCPEEALRYAAFVIAYEALPRSEQLELKAGATGGLAATERQLSYLRALGYRGPDPATRAEASTLIEQMKGGRR